MTLRYEWKDANGMLARRSVMLALAAVAVLAAVLPMASADPPERVPIVVVERPGVPVRLTEIKPGISLMPTDHSVTMVWFVRGAVTNVTLRRIIRIETTWTLVGAQGEVIGAVTNLYERPLGPGERRQTILAVLTELLYKRGSRVIGLVQRVRFEDGSVWTPPPAEAMKDVVPPPRTLSRAEAED